jgi:hypothetical protein
LRRYVDEARRDANFSLRDPNGRGAEASDSLLFVTLLEHPQPLVKVAGKAHLDPGKLVGRMITGAVVRPIFAGLVSFGLIFQALVLSVQFGLLAGPKSGAADFVFVICSEHGSSTLSDQDTPPDAPSTCLHCPLCSHFGAGTPALLPLTAVVAIMEPTSAFDLLVEPERRPYAYTRHPPNRGPPALA